MLHVVVLVFYVELSLAYVATRACWRRRVRSAVQVWRLRRDEIDLHVRGGVNARAPAPRQPAFALAGCRRHVRHSDRASFLLVPRDLHRRTLSRFPFRRVARSSRGSDRPRLVFRLLPCAVRHDNFISRFLYRRELRLRCRFVQIVPSRRCRRCRYWVAWALHTPSRLRRRRVTHPEECAPQCGWFPPNRVRLWFWYLQLGLRRLSDRRVFGYLQAAARVRQGLVCHLVRPGCRRLSLCAVWTTHVRLAQLVRHCRSVARFVRTKHARDAIGSQPLRSHDRWSRQAIAGP